MNKRKFAYGGVRKSIYIKQLECPNCNGSGEVADHPEFGGSKECNQCDGDGYIIIDITDQILKLIKSSINSETPKIVRSIINEITTETMR